MGITVEFQGIIEDKKLSFPNDYGNPTAKQLVGCVQTDMDADVDDTDVGIDT